MTFKDGATVLGSGALNGSGVATFSTASLSVASHNLTAVYGADTNFAGSTSSILAQSVVQDASTTTVVSSVNPSVVGQNVTFTATVTANFPGVGTPSGTVTFKDGATTLNSGSLNGSGVATFSTTALTPGSHNITVVYGGDTNDSASTSIVLNQIVNDASSAVALASSVNPSKFGQAVTFTATLSAVLPAVGTPTGTVTFFDGPAALGTGSLTAGTATLTTSTLAVATHPVTAFYNGDPNFTPSVSSIVSQVVNQSATRPTGLASSSNPSVFGQNITLTATVLATAPGAGTPSGTITFKDGAATALGTAALGNGTAAFQHRRILSVTAHTVGGVRRRHEFRYEHFGESEPGGQHRGQQHGAGVIGESVGLRSERHVHCNSRRDGAWSRHAERHGHL